ncbi:SDR family oxidoreductase [Scytonema sp. PRP1]
MVAWHKSKWVLCPGRTANNAADGLQTKMTALGRYGQGDEVAGMVSYLASSEAAFVTGASLKIDGGYTA